MKVTKRNTVNRILTKRICSPEFKKEGEKIKFLLSYVDEQAYRRSLDTNKELFAFAAGDNEEGQLPDGLDRLYDHQFIIHTDAANKAIGLDIIPARHYRGVVPVKGADVQTIRLEYQLNGAVCVVAHKPYKTKPSMVVSVIKAVDDLITAGKAITLTTKLPGLGKVSAVEGDAVEIKLSASRVGNPMYDLPTEE